MTVRELVETLESHDLALPVRISARDGSYGVQGSAISAQEVYKSKGGKRWIELLLTVDDGETYEIRNVRRHLNLDTMEYTDSKGGVHSLVDKLS